MVLLQYIKNLLLLSNLLKCVSFAQDPNCPPSKVYTAGTGTVLFSPTDVLKQCWSQDELAILTARMIFEDILPNVRSLTLQCNDDIDNLIDYFKSIIESIRGSTKGRKRHLMLLALTDLLGGFLHYVVLPMARRGYYSGVIDYNYIEKVMQLYEELKWFLRTNGQGWAKPLVFKKRIQTAVIDFDNEMPTKPGNDTCCKKLLYYEREPLKSRKRNIPDKGVYFPLPFFDAKFRPTAIVVPFKKFALRNIESKRSAYLVMKYYIAAYKCLKEKKATNEMIEKFQNNLYTWLDKEVIPKLVDDKFYAAFGGIFRVENTLKTLGARVGPAPCSTEEGEEEVGAVPAVGQSSRRTKMVLIAVLIVIVAWFVIGSCFVCYRMKVGGGGKKIDDTKKTESSSSFASSKWSSMWTRSSSRSKTTEEGDTCRCCASSEKSGTAQTSSSEYETEKSRRKDKYKSSRMNKKGSRSTPCICPKKEPAVMETKHSVKMLPSIAEMSENSTATRNRSGTFRRISFRDRESERSSSEGGVKPCAPPMSQGANTVPCPDYIDRTTTISSSWATTIKDQGVQSQPAASSTTKPSTSDTRDFDNYTKQSQNVSNYEFESPIAHSSTIEESTLKPAPPGSDDFAELTSKGSSVVDVPKAKVDSNNSTIEDYHMAACHSSMSGNYALEEPKPYVFGYDFQTSTSSDLSDDDTDIKTSTSKY